MRNNVATRCGADASWQNGVDQAAQWGLTAAQGAAWGAAHKTMLRDTTAALAPNGVLLGKDPWEVRPKKKRGER